MFLVLEASGLGDGADMRGEGRTIGSVLTEPLS